MASSKLLKEAIADAKAVRETALANAKIQLEEAFTPRLKSMLSQKLRAEAEDKADDETKEDADKMDEDLDSSNIGAGNGGTTSGQNNKKPSEHNAGAEDELGAADITSTSKKPEAEVEDYEFEKSITEADGEDEDFASGDVKFATEADEFGGDDSQQHAEPDADNAGGESDYDQDNQSEDDLDLEAIIRELEQELHGGDEGDNIDGTEYDAMGHDQNDMETEAADEVDVFQHADKPEAVIARNESDDKDEDDDLNIESIIKELEDEEEKEQPITRDSIVKEVAKIVKSFYNADNPNVGPFRGGEGIALDCKKQIEEKFGPKAGAFAEQMAGKFIEKLTMEWEKKHGNVGDDGLARLKELVGNIKNKVESIGDVGGHPGKNIMPAEVAPEMESILKLAGLAK